MSVDQQTYEQLVRIKLLYSRAEKLSAQSDDISLIQQIQLLDFTVETLLKLVIRVFPTPQSFALPQTGYFLSISELEKSRYKPDAGFPRACDEVVGRIRDTANNIQIRDLPLRKEIDRLHDLRNSVQHSATVPSVSDARQFLVLVETFLRNMYSDVFGVDYDQASSLSLIQDQSIRERLEKAYQALANSDWNLAAREASIAAHMLLQLAARVRRHQLREVSGLHLSAWSLSQEYHNTNDRSARKVAQEQGEFYEKIVEQILMLYEATFFASCGIGYTDYIRLQIVSSRVSLSINEKYGFHSDKAYNEEEVREILQLVENIILTFQASGIYRELDEELRKEFKSG